VAAGVEAARMAREPLGGATASVVLVFATAGYEQQALLTAISESFAGVALAGCSAEGIITRTVSSESSHAVAIMAIASDELSFETYSAFGFAGDSDRCGRELARQIVERSNEGGLLLLFPDGISGNCRELVRALEDGLPAGFSIVGGTAGDLLTFERTFQYHDGRVHEKSVSAVVVRGAFVPELVVTHGCDLVGLPKTVTHAEGGFVYTIDGQSAWSLFKGYMDPDANGLEAMHLAHLLLAEHLPVRSSGVIDDYSARVPVRLEEQTGALYFAAGLTTGTRVQVALRNEEKVCERAELAARDLASRRPGQRPILVLQFDCAGRGRLLLGEHVHERLVAPMLRAFDGDVPWIGLNTYGEIGPIDSQTYFHNYTAVLCALYPNAEASE
jgi:hypothetical protein